MEEYEDEEGPSDMHAVPGSWPDEMTLAAHSEFEVSPPSSFASSSIPRTILCHGRSPYYLPKKMTPGSLGYDLRLEYDVTIPRKSRCTLSYGIGFGSCFREAWTGCILKGRTYALSRDVIIFDQIVDIDYLGVIHSECLNATHSTVTLYEGERVAQLIFPWCPEPTLINFEFKEESFWNGYACTAPLLDRGHQGNGSTGSGLLDSDTL